MTASQLFLGMVLSAILCSQVRGKDVPAAEALEQTRTGNPSCLAMQEAIGDLANLTGAPVQGWPGSCTPVRRKSGDPTTAVLPRPWLPVLPAFWETRP
jgi:hypothetical protein